MSATTIKPASDYPKVKALDVEIAECVRREAAEIAEADRLERVIADHRRVGQTRVAEADPRAILRGESAIDSVGEALTKAGEHRHAALRFRRAADALRIERRDAIDAAVPAALAAVVAEHARLAERLTAALDECAALVRSAATLRDAIDAAGFRAKGLRELAPFVHIPGETLDFAALAEMVRREAQDARRIADAMAAVV